MTIATSTPSEQRLTVRALFDSYIRLEVPKLSETAATERIRILNLFAAKFGDRIADEMMPEELLVWVAKHKQWDSDWTKRQKAEAVQRPYNWAVKLRMVRQNPFVAVVFEEGDPRRAMTDREFTALLRHSTDARWRQLLLFLRHTGCRPGEMSAATWADVDWESSLIKLEKHKTRKKTKKPRIIPLPPLVVSLLRVMHRRSKGIGLIFLTQRGTAWNRSNTSIRMQRLRKRAGVPDDCKLYGTRHAFGTVGVLNGAPMKLLSKALGHASVSTTERFYCHVDHEIEAIRAAAILAGKPRQLTSAEKGGRS